MSARGYLRPALLLAAGAAVVALIPLVVSDFRQFQLAYVGVYFIAILGLNLLTGYAGQISLGHGGFMMVGAYTTAILSRHHGIPDVWTIPLAGLAAGAVGLPIGLIVLRFRGVYLALATFAIPVVAIQVARKYSETFGNQNLPNIHTGSFVYWLTWPVAGLLFVLAWLLVRGRFGRALRTIRESEIAATSSGIDPTRYKTAAFVISAAYAGVAGALFAIAVAYVNPDTFPISLSLLLLTGIVVGGLGSLGGVVVGALFVEYVQLYAPDILSGFQKVVPLHLDPKATGASQVVYGVVLMLVLLLLPAGATGLFRLIGARAGGRSRPRGASTPG